MTETGGIAVVTLGYWTADSRMRSVRRVKLMMVRFWEREEPLRESVGNKEWRIKNWRKEHLDTRPSLFLDTVLYNNFAAAK